MQAAEIELKFPVSDPQALQSRLPSLGFHLVTPRTYEHNTLFDTPARDLRAKRQILRLREYGGIHTLTHKRVDASLSSDTSRYKIRIETETTVSDHNALAEVFTHLGYLPAFVYDKYRTEFATVDPAACLTDSYGKLFLGWKQRTGSPAENLTFAEISSPVLTPR